jgi:hypothetical protein
MAIKLFNETGRSRKKLAKAKTVDKCLGLLGY